ncbi:hypothetical protein R3W88_000631 [Solanum pinnatisectum]|uniref:Uncharacterized protein n=1 Tax=Solanum pinnatisectum TaxID=50273 RepID=A0AAV9MII7_9SOLN|nr:hypothetical protein R3W88_000631 [Solanum pinnatisectum]
MELWEKMMDPMRKAWSRVSTGIHIRKTGHVKLHRDVRKCEYEDVQILWDMLKKNEKGSEASKSPFGRKKVRFWDIINCAKRAPFICRSVINMFLLYFSSLLFQISAYFFTRQMIVNFFILLVSLIGTRLLIM